MRTHPCVRLFCIIDTLTITSMLPGVDDSIDDVPLGGRAGWSRPHLQYVTTIAARSGLESHLRREPDVAEAADLAAIVSGARSIHSNDDALLSSITPALDSLHHSYRSERVE